jgi:hypothetical protein
MLSTTVLSALVLAGSALAQPLSLAQEFALAQQFAIFHHQSTEADIYTGSSEYITPHVFVQILTHTFIVSFTLRYQPDHVGACGRVCDGSFTCEVEGKVTKCKGGDARIPADIFYK